MFNKIRKVLTVYTSSWSFWIISGIIIGCFIFIPLSISLLKMDSTVMKNSTTFNSPVIPRPETGHVSFLTTKFKVGKSYRKDSSYGKYISPEDLELDLSQLDLQSESVKVSGLASSHQGLWKCLMSMPNLKHLDLENLAVIDVKRYKFMKDKLSYLAWIDYSELENLEKLKTLSSLKFPSGTFNQKTLEVVGKLPNLKWLDANSLFNVDRKGSYRNSIDSLPILKNLETLQISSISLLARPETFEKLKLYRKLRTIIVGNGMEGTSYWHSVDYEKIVQNLSSLGQAKQMYLPKWFLERYQRLNSDVPNINFYSTSAYNHRIIFTVSICWLIAIVSMMIGHSLWAQFSRPESKLIPGYSQPHITNAFFLFIALGICGTMLLLICNIALNAAIALSICSMSVLVVLSFPGLYSYFRWCFWISFLVLMLYAGFQPFPIQTVDRFLEGSIQTTINAAIFTGSFILASSILSMKHLYGKLTKAGYATPIIQISDLRLIDRPKKKNWIPLVGTITTYLLMPVRFNLSKSTRKSKPSSLRQKLQKWRKLTESTSNRTLLYSSLTIVLFEVHWFSIQNWQSNNSGIGQLSDYGQQLHWNVWVVIFGMTYFLVPIACIGWWKRIPMLANELCFPIERPQLLKSFYWGLWQDIFWYSVAFVLLTSPMFFATHSITHSLAWLSVYFISVFGLSVFWYGLALFVLLVRSSWKIVLFEFFVVLLFFVLTSIISDHFIYESNSEYVQMNILLSLGVSLFILGSVILLCARNYWSKLEFAKLV